MYLKRNSFYRVSVALVMAFAMYGCHTAGNTITPESSVPSSQSTPVHLDAKNPETMKQETGLVKEENTVREKSTPVKNSEVMTKKYPVEGTEKSAETEKMSVEEFEKNLFSKWSGLLGHGGVSQVSPAEKTTEESSEQEAGKPEGSEEKSFPELEKKVVGKWLNEKETESMEFFDDKTIFIGNEQGSRQMIKGNFRFVDRDHLSVDFQKGLFRMPSMSFVITVSDKELTLTGEDDGIPTTYKRVK
ncbi:MAG: hypothetical protein MRK02_16770 [Candidatus Scalindua sp.]|nr:hypothetical protein [Candidatus Scalindua sp.]